MSFISQRAALAAGPLSTERMMSLAPSIFATEKHESRSERYAYIPTSAVVDGMRENGFLPVHVAQGKSRIPGKADFTKHLIRFRQAGEVGTKQVGGLFPEVILVNSHDGTSAYRLMSGLFRVVCLNGLYASDATFADMRVPHKGDVVDRVIEGSFQVLEDSRQALLQAEDWAGIRMGVEAQRVLAEEAHALRFGDADGNVETPIRPDQLNRARRADDRGDNVWATHNRIQENVIRGGLTAYGRDAENRQRRVTTREVKGIDGDVRLNRGLARLSERMAQILGG